MADFVAGDTGSKIQITCVDTSLGAPINITGSTVSCVLIAADATRRTQAATTVDATNGVVSVPLLATDLVAGVLQVETTITTAGATTTALQPMSFVVRPRL